MTSIDAVEEDRCQKVLSPAIIPEVTSWDVMFYADRADEVFGYCQKYEFTSLGHVTMTQLRHTMMRTSSAHVLDVWDFHPGDRYPDLRHRPETGTPIKNKSGGERLIALLENVWDFHYDWIGAKLPSRKDTYHRDSVLATNRGLASKSTIRKFLSE